MNLTGQQQRALEHARDVLAEAPTTGGTALLLDWYRIVRMALAELTAALENETPDGGAS